MSERGFLVCADITGYTHYLDESELDHASRILSDLLDLLLGEVQTPLRLSRVEGDAVISYAPAVDAIGPRVLVDRIESTYVAFRRALDQIVANSLCTCRACANLSSLDLKFIVHHGDFVVQQLRNQDELVGPDVNLLFRLAKNGIREKLGTPGYLALTEAAVDALALPEYLGGFVEHEEPSASGEAVSLFVKDMAPLWAERRSRGTIDMAAEEVLVTVERPLPVRLSVAWDYLTSPETRSIMFGSDREPEVRSDADGRLGVDSVYVCWLGQDRIEHRIIDWDPPTRYAFSAPFGDDLTGVGEFRLSPDFDHTMVVFRGALPRHPGREPPSEEVRAKVVGGLTPFIEGAFDRIARRVDEDVARA